MCNCQRCHTFKPDGKEFAFNLLDHLIKQAVEATGRFCDEKVFMHGDEKVQTHEDKQLPSERLKEIIKPYLEEADKHKHGALWIAEAMWAAILTYLDEQAKK